MNCALCKKPLPDNHYAGVTIEQDPEVKYIHWTCLPMNKNHVVHYAESKSVAGK